MRSIGSPFTRQRRGTAGEIEESRALFDYAFQNRIGLLYLEALDALGQLNDLSVELRTLRVRERETSVTAARAAALLEGDSIPFFLFLTLYPFPATPNDVEFIVLGSREDYRRAISSFAGKGYQVLTSGPDTNLLADPRGGDAIQRSKNGGIYYVDLAMSVSLDFFQFLDLRSVRSQLTIQRDRFGYGFPALPQPLELAVSITHSVLEQRLGLEVIYFLYYYLASAGKEGVEALAHAAREHHMSRSVAPVLSIGCLLHRAAFGFVPEQLSEAVESIGGRESEALCMQRNGYSMPHKLRTSTFVDAVLGKLGEGNARATMLKQLSHMLDPSFSWDVARSLWKHRMSPDIRPQH